MHCCTSYVDKYDPGLQGEQLAKSPSAPAAQEGLVVGVALGTALGTLVGEDDGNAVGRTCGCLEG